jgi:hypothetical protein
MTANSEFPDDVISKAKETIASLMELDKIIKISGDYSEYANSPTDALNIIHLKASAFYRKLYNEKTGNRQKG